jgi:hypothetical protein
VTGAAVLALALAGDAGPLPPLHPGTLSYLPTYLWQFYLPDLPGQVEIARIPELPVYDVWLKTGWAAFGWLEVTFPEPVYALLAVLSAAAFVAAGVVLRRQRLLSRELALFFGLTALALLAGLHFTEYAVVVGDESPTAFNQGRYLLPLIPLGGLAVAMACLLAGRRREHVVAAVLAGLFVLQAFSLGLVVERFYA